MIRALVSFVRLGPSAFRNSLKVRRFCAKSLFWSSFFYCFISRKFRREHSAVLNAICNFQNGEMGAVLGNLRRDLHRIEKGLHTRPRKPVFALDYILPTVRSLDQVRSAGCSEETVLWAEDVLSDYFDVVEREGCIVDAYALFTQQMKARTAPTLSSPAAKPAEKSSPVSFDALAALCRQRQSVRYYQHRPVPRETVEEAVRVALQSPSACNRQPLEVFIAEKGGALRELCELPMGSVTFAANMQCLAFLVGDLNAYFDERDRHLIYIDAGLFAMSLCLALETMGLSSCIINWPDIEEKEAALAGRLNLPPHKRCVLCISIGYADPDAASPSSRKKTADEVMVFLDARTECGQHAVESKENLQL